MRWNPIQLGDCAITELDGQVDRPQIGIWPALKTVHFAGASSYVGLAIYAEPSFQDHFQDEEESRLTQSDARTS